MLNILIHSIARAGGIEIVHLRTTEVRSSEPARASLIGRLVEGHRRVRARRETYRALARLNDHALRDIGLHRGMLENAAHDLANLKPANDNRPAWLAGSDRTRPRAAGCG